MSAMTELPKLYRTLPIDVAQIRAADATAGDPTIDVAISSEYEVARWFGGEVLDHTSNAIDRTYLDQGMAVLVDHDTGRHIGVVQNPQLGADRVLRGTAVFDSEDPESMRIYRKVAKGQMRFTSVGYRVNEMVLEKSDTQQGETYRATRWTPYEVSFVSVPADPTVGAGRSAAGDALPVVIRTPAIAPQGQESVMSDLDTAPPTGAPEKSHADVRAGINAEYRDIAALAEQHGMLDKLPSWIGEGRSVNDVRGEILSEVRERMKRGAVIKPRVELSEKEEKEYSFARAIMHQVDGDACFERDVSDQIAKNLPQGYKPMGGIFVPTNVRNHVSSEVQGKALLGAMKRAGIDSKTATKGAEMTFDTPGSFIDLLRNTAQVIRAGATVLSGLDTPVTFPKQTGASTASWVAENPGSDVAEVDLLFGTVSLTPKTLQATTSFSRQALRIAAGSNYNVEAILRADMAAQHGLAIDAAALFGTGASNQPRGVFNLAGANVVALGTNGAAPAYVNMIGMYVKIAAANADGLGSMALITSPEFAGTLMTTQKFASTNGQAVWENDQVGPMAAYVSNQVQKNLVKGSSGAVCHAAYAGVWSQLYIGEFGAAEFVVDPYRLKKQGMIEVTSFQMADIAARYDAAFSVIKDALVTAF